MKLILALFSIIAFGAGIRVASAEEGGCLKYGAGGAVAGHFVGSGHALGGAAAGCAVGAYKRHEARKEARGHDEANRADQGRPDNLR
jgi:hypothetical protein